MKTELLIIDTIRALHRGTSPSKRDELIGQWLAQLAAHQPRRGTATHSNRQRQSGHLANQRAIIEASLAIGKQVRVCTSDPSWLSDIDDPNLIVEIPDGPCHGEQITSFIYDEWQSYHAD